MADDNSLTGEEESGAGAFKKPAPLETKPLTGPVPAVQTTSGGPAGPNSLENAPAAPASPQGPPTHAAAKLNADIARILQEVRLPERRHPASEPSPAAKVAPTANAPAAATQPAASANIPPRQSSELPTTPLPEHPPAPGQQETESSEESERTPVVSLHTMKTDLQDIVREQKISLVRAASMEADRHRARPSDVAATSTPGRRRTILLMIAVALVLFGLGGAAISGVYAVMLAQNAAQTPVSPSLLFAENQIALPINGQSSSALKKTLGGMLSNTSLSVGSITQIVPTEPQNPSGARPATLSEFLHGVGAHPPDDLVRALSSDFFFGIHAADVPAPLFVIPVVSYDRAFAGMLAWEGAIDTDLSALFKQVPAVAAGDQGLPIVRQFVDLVVRNYDTRALKDDSGAVVLYYSFPTPNLLIIAASPYTFPEVLSRLQADRKL